MTLLNSASHLFLKLDPTRPMQRWQVNLNQLCLHGILPWLQDEFGVDLDQVNLEARSHHAIWELVGGSAVTIGETTRLVLLPSAAIDSSELRVPQEWVDIPSWVGDYYVGVQVNPDDSQLRVWGYTTHACLKQHGRYDLDDRTYCLDGEAVTDLAILPISRALCPEEPTRVSEPALPELPLAQAESLIQRLGRSDFLMPRLEVPVSLWNALLANPGLRSRLFEARQADARQANWSQPDSFPQDPSQTSQLVLARTASSPGPRTDLGLWLRSLTQTEPPDWLAQGWQALESLLPSNSEVARAFRRSEATSTIRRGKRLTLDTGADIVTVLLLIAAESEADGRISVRAQLRPEADARLLEGIEIRLLSPSGDVVQAVRSQPPDDYIQLKRFRLPPGYTFNIQVHLGKATVLEPFTT